MKHSTFNIQYSACWLWSIEEGPCPDDSAWYPGAIGEGLRVVQPHSNLAIKMCNVTAKLYVDILTDWLAIVFS